MALVTHMDFSLEPLSVDLWSRLVATPTAVVRRAAAASLGRAGCWLREWLVVHRASGGGGGCNCPWKLSLWQ